MPRPLHTEQNELARRLLKEVLDDGMSQEDAARALGFKSNGQVSRLLNGGGTSTDVLVRLGRLRGQSEQVARVLNLLIIGPVNEADMPAALRAEIARDPNRPQGIAVAKSYEGADGKHFRTQEQWRQFIDHMQAQANMIGSFVAQSPPTLEDAYAGKAAEQKRAKRPRRLPAQRDAEVP